MLLIIWFRPPCPHPPSSRRSSVSQGVETSPAGPGSAPGSGTAGSKTCSAERGRGGEERQEAKNGERDDKNSDEQQKQELNHRLYKYVTVVTSRIDLWTIVLKP